MAETRLPYEHRDLLVGVDIRATTYRYGRGHTDTGIQITLESLTGPTAGTILAGRLPREHALALAQAILAEAEPDPTHVIEFRADGWTIQHPLACRPNLFACPVNRAAEHDLAGVAVPPGRYECEVNDLGDRFYLGDRLPEAAGGER